MEEKRGVAERKKDLTRPYMYNNLDGLADLQFWMFKHLLEVEAEAFNDRQRITALLERIAGGMGAVSQPREIVVVHEEKRAEFPPEEPEPLPEPMESVIAEKLDTGLFSRIKRKLKG